MSATHTEERIEKLLRQGLACRSIANKIGRPGDLARVHKVGCNSEEEVSFQPIGTTGSLPRKIVACEAKA